MEAFTVNHFSGSKEIEQKVFRSHLLEFSSDSVFTSGTEVARSYYDDLLPVEGFSLVHGRGNPGRRECFILADSDYMTLKYWDVREVTEGGGKDRLQWSIYITIGVYEDREGNTYIYITFHFPAHVEAGFRLAARKRVAAVRKNRQAIRNMFKELSELLKMYPDAKFICAGDWNLNFKMPWVRNFVRRQAKKQGVAVRFIYSKTKGTFKGRSIDVIASNMFGDAVAIDEHQLDHNRLQARLRRHLKR